MNVRKIFLAPVFFFSLGAIAAVAHGKTVEYYLTIEKKVVNITGVPVPAMTINGGIPGPTLYFTEGDLARIHVHNLMNVETSIHWHGILVPPDMDGVPYVSFPPIQPGETFTYEFPIRHSGTYWYHSHTGLQEQKGLYGGIVIKSAKDTETHSPDHVVLFSDWTDESTHEVLRTLKRGSDWYALEKGSAQSLTGAIKAGMLGHYLTRELLRMPPMDISDIAYDGFLANGRREIEILSKPGETVRMRIINGSAGSNFYLEYAGGPMTIISADGQDVEPVEIKRLLIAIAETYDVLIQIPREGAFELRATAQDGSGYASVWVGTGEHVPAPAVPRPNLYYTMGNVTLGKLLSLTPQGAMGMRDSAVREGAFDIPWTMGGMMKKHTARAEMKATENPPPQSRTVPVANKTVKYGKIFRLLASDVSSSGVLAVDRMDPERPWPPYSKLRAKRKTSFEETKPVRIIRLTLDGDMERYVWFMNNKALSESDSILIRKGEAVRFILVNRTMMHHPMHLHGHFFRVVNKHGDYSPLKHTVDVPPMSTVVIEFDANELGDWFFHCHLLYHLKSGMAQVVHYEGFSLPPSLAAVRPNLYRESWYFWGQVNILSSSTEGFLTLANTRNILSAEWEVGWNSVDETEWEGILTWGRYVNRFFSWFVGADVGNGTGKEGAIAGIRYLLPLNIETASFVGTGGNVRLAASKSISLTPRIALSGLAQYDSEDGWEGSAQMEYVMSKGFSFIFKIDSEYEFGAGFQLRF